MKFFNKISLDWPLTLTFQPSISKLSDNPALKVKGQGKASTFTITHDSNNMTDKLEIDGLLILPPSLHQCSILSVFKASGVTINRILD